MPQGSFLLEIVKPDGPVLSETVEEAVLPGAEGSFGVLAGHAPMLAALGVGEVMYKQGGRPHYLALDGGFCEVRQDRVTVLAERAERAESIDVERAGRARDRAAESLRDVKVQVEHEVMAAAQARLRRAEVRLEVAAKRAKA